MNDKIVVGQLVKSKSGRDKGRYFLIFAIEPNGYVLLVDGGKRGVNNPKKKNMNHIQLTNSVVQEFAEKIHEDLMPRDHDIRRYLQKLEVD